MRLMETHAHWGSMEKLAVNQTIVVHTSYTTPRVPRLTFWIRYLYAWTHSPPITRSNSYAFRQVRFEGQSRPWWSARYRRNSRFAFFTHPSCQRVMLPIRLHEADQQPPPALAYATSPPVCIECRAWTSSSVMPSWSNEKSCCPSWRPMFESVTPKSFKVSCRIS